MLFQSFAFPNGTTAKNRFFKSAMEEQLATDNQPTQALVNLYRTWALGVGVGVLLSALFFADKIGRYLRVQSSSVGELMVYDVKGQVFFANANSFVASFAFDQTLKTVKIDVSNAHFWDISAVNALDKVVANHQRLGVVVQVVGLNKASQTLIDNFGNKDLAVF